MPETERQAQLQHKGMQHALEIVFGQRMHISDKQKQGTETNKLAIEWFWIGSYLQVPCPFWQSCHTLETLSQTVKVKLLPSEHHPPPQHSHRPSAECGMRPHLPAPS